MLPKVIVLMGLPGSGKGTQAKKLAERYNYGHISTGNLLRAIDQDPHADPEDKKQVAAMKDGALVSDDFIYKIAFTAIKTYFDEERGVVLDGAIRTVAQARHYDEFFQDEGLEDSLVVFDIQISEETVMERILNRAKISGGQGREDDTPEMVRKRLQKQGKDVIEPVLDYYRKQDRVIAIDGEQSIEAVEQDIIVALKMWPNA